MKLNQPERIPERVALFLPWHCVGTTVDVGPLCLAPYHAAHPSLGLSDLEHEALVRVLSSYRTSRGDPVPSWTMAYYRDRGCLAGLDAEARDEAFQLLDLFKVTCLSNRNLTGSWGSRYCNSDVLYAVGNGIDVKSAFVTVSTRTATGFSRDSNDVSSFRFSVPRHASRSGMEPVVDRGLLDALLTLRGDAESTNALRRLWARVADGANAFILANTDSDAFRPHLELVLLAGGFQRLLGASESKEAEMGRELEALIRPRFAFHVQGPALAEKGETPAAQTDEDDVEDQTRAGLRADTSPRSQWMREFYGLRNEYAHGASAHRRESVWTMNEHLFAARVAYPIVLKTLLAGEGRYELTKGDNDVIDSFERFICYPSLYQVGSSSGLAMDYARSWLLLQQMRARGMELLAERRANRTATDDVAAADAEDGEDADEDEPAAS